LLLLQQVFLFYSVLPNKFPGLIGILISLMALTSCKKDLIRPQRITRLESHTGNRLNSIRFINDSTGFIAGGNRFLQADVLITRDGGATWVRADLPETDKELFGITLSPSGAVYIIGFDGHLLRSYDEGRTWKHTQLRYESYKAIAFSNAAQAHCAGGISFNRGDALSIDSSGTVLDHDSLGYELNDIVLLPGGSGFRCGYGAMQYTKDGGKSWQWANINNDNFTSLYVRSAEIAYACGGEGSICMTSNGGKDWTTLRNGNDLTRRKYRLRDLIFTDVIHGYAVGEGGKVIHTDDAGRHWSELEHFTDANLHGISRCPNGDLLICGEGGEIWRIKW
jgi:photosystem II stability/assembly factor-like uncharacterized protein